MQETPKKLIFSKKTVIIAVAVVLVIAIILGMIIYYSANAIPKYDPLKYNNTVHTAIGGEKQENANIKNIGITKDDGAENINLDFVSGSLLDANADPCGIPEYVVEFIPSPLRLKITFKNIVYWDYMVAGIPVASSELINGAFQMSPAEDGGDTVLYFTLTKAVAFKIIENESTLTVSLIEEVKDAENEKWYLTADLYYEYQTGQMPQGNFTPILCDDNISVIMISEAYKSLEDAQKAKEELLASDFEGISISVVSLKQGQLPPYGSSLDSQALLSESVLSIDGAKTTLPLFYADARFLTWLPDGSGALFAKNEDGLEKLYVADKAGTKRLLVEQGFSTVVKAVYSSDCSRLAFIEQAEDTSVITVIDVKSGKITVVGNEENVLGEIIMGVQLNENGTKLFFLSGNSTYSLQVYDFATGQITNLDTDILVESDLIYHNGYLYYCDVIDEYEAVVRLRSGCGEAELIHKGSQFKLSSDGKKIAVISEDYETAVCDLKVIHIETGLSESVLDDIVTSDFFFTPSGESVFYVLETGDPEFYYQLVRYDLTTKETTVMAQCINSVFYPSDKDNEIIISVIYSGENGAQPVTYIADFDKMVVGETAPAQG